MEQPGRSSVYVAPLQVVKGKTTAPTGSTLTSNTPTNYDSNFRSQASMTPPLTPQASNEDVRDRQNNQRSVFHNYLRAFYPYHPAGAVSPSTVTLPLNAGDIILVHSVHTNGWADGTLLETGARGWLPTNYCEAYDQKPMRHLLKALTDFWDIIRGGSGSTLAVFTNQDYMRGLIAGVRFLLEKSDCLTRDTPLVQKHDALRKTRKVLLADLSSLVKTAKKLQDIANGLTLDADVDIILDEMLLKAFKIVTRGVRFLDVWNENIDIERAIEDLAPSVLIVSQETQSMPLTPPADGSHSSSSASRPSTSQERLRPSTSTSVRDPHSRLGHANKRVSTDRMSSHGRPEQIDSSQQGLTSTFGRPKRVSVTHRMSHGGRPSGVQTSNLASERLNTTYDAFLGVLGSFIGLHLQSRSSSELLVTTQQSVKSCRELLTVIDAVMEHDSHRSELLQQAKDSMYDKITELVHAARDVFRPVHSVDEEVVFMPDEGKRLVNAATDCVRGAGECVAKTRYVLEQIGDFEYEPIGLGMAPLSFDGVETSAATVDKKARKENDSVYEDTARPQPPRLHIPEVAVLSASPTLSATETLSSEVSGTIPPTPLTPSDSSPSKILLPPLSLSTSFVGTGDATPSSTNASPLSQTQHDSPVFRLDGRVITSTGSTTTHISSMRNSDHSGVSQTSTRATSPDGARSNHIATPSLSNSFHGSQTTLADEYNEAEAKVLEKTFAHELMYNKDGQIIGGTLPALIEKLTAHHSTPDAMFVSTFYLTFRLFVTPLGFAEALGDRFDYMADTPQNAGPVRLRVYNVFKQWLESHWRHDCDNVALDYILNFARNRLMLVLPTAGKRLTDLAEKVSAANGPLVPRLVSSIGKTNTAIAQYVNPEAPLPAPTISKGQLSILKNWKHGGPSPSILDFDPLELARQFTIKESAIFCSILPEELLATEWNKRSGSLAVNVRAMSTLSTDLANLVADCILQQEEPKKRAAIIKQWVKIGNKCVELNNYDSLMAIICALNSSTIARMKRTWEVVSAKTKAALDELNAIVVSDRNYSVLRQRLQNHVPPCLPFVGMYLTDLTFVDHGNQAMRQLATEGASISVINFDKHMKTAKIISELQRFQIPYRLMEVPELQTWMQDQLVRVRSGGEKAFQAHYRRSLILEPRAQPKVFSENPPQLSRTETAKEKFDFLAWAHPSKDKSIATHG